MKRRNAWLLLLSGAMASACVVAACDGGGNTVGTTNGGAGAGSTGGSGGEGGGFIPPTDGGEQSLVISPIDPILDVTGQPKTLPFAAKFSNGSNPSAIDWYLDDVTVGTIAADGVFASGGFVAGKAKVTAKTGALEASTTMTVRVKIADNGAGLSSDDMTKLATGGSADPGFRWLYPYDKTIFPRGHAAPTLQ